MRKKTAAACALIPVCLFAYAHAGGPENGKGVLYLVNHESREIRVVDPDLKKKVGAMAAGLSPLMVAASRDGRLLAVTQKEDLGEWPEAVLIIDREKGGVIAGVNIYVTRYRVRGDSFPVFSMDSKKLYTAESGTGFLNVIDTSDWKLVKKLAVGVSPVRPALSPDGKRLYVPCPYSAEVAVVDTDEDLVVGSIKIDGEPSAIAFGPEGAVYVADRRNNRVVEFDPSGQRVERVFITGSSPEAMALVNNSLLFVMNRKSGDLSVIDLGLGEEVKRMAVAPLPLIMAYDPGARRLYVAPEDASISVVDTENLTRLKSIPLDATPTDMVFAP